MPDISSIGHGPVGPLDRTAPPGARRDADAPRELDKPPQRLGDRVELSDHARFLDRLRRMPPTQTDRVQQIRQAIADGTYETDDKLEVAIDRIMEELGIE